MNLKDVLNELIIYDFKLSDSESKIADDIGISKQLLNKFRNRESTKTTPEVYNKIYNWAVKRGLKNINLAWIMGVSDTKFLSSSKDLCISQNAIQQVIKLSQNEYINVLNYILESEQFNELVKDLSAIPIILQESIFELKEIEIDYLLFKFQERTKDLAKSCLQYLYNKEKKDFYNRCDDETKEILSNYRHDFPVYIPKDIKKYRKQKDKKDEKN